MEYLCQAQLSCVGVGDLSLLGSETVVVRRGVGLWSIQSSRVKSSKHEETSSGRVRVSIIRRASS
jgi:hypothetical protein